MARRRTDGQGLVEYALIILLVGLALIVALGLLSGGLSAFYGDAASAFS